MTELEQNIRTRLLQMQDKTYQAFQCKLMPNVEAERVIGVRTPQLRAYAKELAKNPDSYAFLECLPHYYYEENNVHSFLIERIRKYEECIHALDEFLPYVDNWATCDSMKPKVLEKHLPELWEQIQRWIASSHPYMIRFGIELLMNLYLGDSFEIRQAELVASVKSKEYYVNMMIAWYFATALAKQYTQILPFIEKKVLEPWTHNKTIQKAVESYRISTEEKQYLRSLKICSKK